MGKWLLTDWEINGSDDSDFMCSYYDDVKDEILTHCYGTTRFAAPRSIGFSADGKSTVVIDGEALVLPTKEIVERARLKLAEHIFLRMQTAETRLVNDPDVADLREGMKIRLKVSVRNQVMEMKPCEKCAGSGHWVNPKNSSDKRECFACNSTGEIKIGKQKDQNGKLKYEVLPAGLTGEVVKWGSFGTFFRNGYKKPDQHNTTVQFRTVEGKVIRATLKNLRLDRECMSESDLHQKADDASRSLEFSKVYPRHAWDCANFAARVMNS